ncbi:cysteine hydrolase family protein [Mycolicibacterium stellerae]|uniref:cysteine hydrolase family protein n=1 Tax=Mycolicibacterium stellerae TaxID=2358193 RepID=UPI001F19F4B0|nr:cysteine hydrolase [Mycolicibacterium stellerae]
MTDRPQERNALLLMDFQTSVIPAFGGDNRLLRRIAELSEATRHRDVDVVHVRISLPRGLAEVGPANRVFTEVATSLASEADTGVHPAIAPAADDFVVTKKRVSAFSGSDLDLLLRARRIGTVVLAGVSTSGVVLSTVRQAADLDYRIVVLADGCADSDDDVHSVLLRKVFPPQADVMSIGDWSTSL